MKESDRLREAETALAARSRHQAETELGKVAPPRIAAAINTFIEWRALAYWIRLIADKLGTPAAEPTIRERCPGFLEYFIRCCEGHPGQREFLWLQLIDWIDSHYFLEARAEGWQHALGYYAARDQRLDRIRAYWLKCDDQWDDHARLTPPTFDEWRRAALEHV